MNRVEENNKSCLPKRKRGLPRLKKGKVFGEEETGREGKGKGREIDFKPGKGAS